MKGWLKNNIKDRGKSVYISAILLYHKHMVSKEFKPLCSKYFFWASAYRLEPFEVLVLNLASSMLSEEVPAIGGPV